MWPTSFLTLVAAALMEENDCRSSETKWNLVVGEMVSSSWISGWAVVVFRPMRMKTLGLPWARKREVCAPRLPGVGPVIATE